MAEVANGANALETASPIPIAELSPSLPDAAKKSIKAVITIAWPYSSATGCVAFLLSEPDFRLRRSRGQVRVQFSGSSAKAVRELGIASGDEVFLSLDGVEWLQNETTETTPGRGVEFELKFTERLLLQFKQDDSNQVKRIDINHPELEIEPPLPSAIPEIEVETAVLALTSHKRSRSDSISKLGDEYSSPAFIKRARTSYGSLFDSDYDPFEDDDSIKQGKGRKRTRLSSTWRYSSRSPTPEFEELESSNSKPDDELPEAPTMMDEACQTTDLEEDNAAAALANFARQASNVGVSSYPKANGTAVPKESRDETRSKSHSLSPNQEIQERSEVPVSPTLKPIQSDSLPLVSPLVTPKDGLLFSHSKDLEMGAQVNQQHLAVNEQARSLIEAEGHVNEDDLYNASPPGRRISGTAFAPVNTVHTSHQVDTEPELPDGHLWRDEGEGDQHLADSFMPSVGLEPSGISQYPDPNDGLQDHTAPAWSSIPSSVVYPPLPAFSEKYEEEESNQEKLALHSAPMSRSQSARSAPIDLTESSGEEAEGGDSVDEDEDEDAEMEDSQRFSAIPTHRNPQYNQEVSDDDQDDLEEEEHYDDRGQQYAEHDEDEDEDEEDQPRSRYAQEISGEEDEEEYSDEEGNRADQYLSRQDSRPQGEYDDDAEEEEEESYDEEEMEDEMPPTQRNPVVIDLLSSDDEGDENTTASRPTPAASTTHASQQLLQAESVEESEESEESGSDEDMEVDENAQNAAQQLLAIDSDRNSAPPSEDEDDDAIYEDDDQLEIEEDEEDRMEIEDEVEQQSFDRSEIYPLKKDVTGELENENFKIDPSGSHRENDDDNDVIDAEESAANPLIDRPLSQLSKPPPERPSLFSRVFNLDGANDDPSEVPYPTLPIDNSPPPPIASSEKPQAQFSEEVSIEQVNVQLPTPDATQLSQNLVSTEVSFSDGNIIPQAESSNNEADTLQTEATEERLATDLVEAAMEIVTELHESSQPAMITDSSTAKNEQLNTDQLEDSEIFVSSNGKLEENTMMVDAVEVNAEADNVVPEHETTDITETPAKIYNEEPLVEETEKDIVIADTVSELDTTKISKNHAEETNDEQTIEVIEVLRGDEGAINTFPEFEMNENTEHPPEASIEEQIIEEQPVEEASGDEDEDEFVNTLTNELLAQRTVFEGAITRSKAKQQNDHAELAAEEPEYTIEAPRRSHRRAKSTTSTIHTEEEVHSMTPIKSELAKDTANSEKENSSPMIVINSHATPKGHDASIELALSSLDSPSKPQRELRTSPVVDLKLRLSRTLRTELSEFTSLKVLRYHLNKKLDVLAVATTTPPEPQRAKNGPRHYQITFNITDPSVAPSGVSEVQIFRPYKEALPVVRAGDGILLRNFQVVSVKARGGFALKSSLDEGSSWAIFRDGEEDQVRGPPVEYGIGEKNHIIALKAWYGTLDSVARAKITRANGDKSSPAKGVGKVVS